MSWNVPSGTAANVSFGPALVLMGAAGATPSTDVGYIDADDGVTFEVTGTMKDVAQGNPKLAEFRFLQQMAAKLSFTSIEWDQDQWANALGAGVTATTSTEDTFYLGGDPTPTELAIRVQHAAAKSSNTMSLDIWKATGDGNFTFGLKQDEHKFPQTFMALRATTDWASSSLVSGRQLFRVYREKP